MSLIDRMKNKLAKTDSEAKQPVETRIRVKAIKCVPAIGIATGNTYLMSPSDAHHAHVVGWGEILDRVPGFNAPHPWQK